MINIFGVALHETTEEIKECWETEERRGASLLFYLILGKESL